MLTIIIPVFNEINTIEKLINKVLAENFISKEIILRTMPQQMEQKN